MKLSLFLLITTIISLAFAQNTSPKSTDKRLPNQVKNVSLNLEKEANSNATTPIVLEQENTTTSISVSEEEDAEAYLNFVREQMKESVREHLKNIQRKLGEESVEQAERLILM